MIAFIRVLLTVLVGTSVYFTIREVPLVPEVGRNFFFSEEDLQFQSEKDIQALFGRNELVVIAVEGDIHSDVYQRKIQQLTNQLLGVHGIESAKSLSHGPSDLKDVLEGPLWNRLLLFEEKSGSNIVLIVGAGDYSTYIPEIIRVVERYNSPAFQTHISGIPFIIERIKHYLLEDLKAFTLFSALVLFAVSVFFFRSATVLWGMIASSAFAASTTLLTIHAFNIQLGVLTANLLTVVFVLTGSHLVFLTFAASKSLNRSESQIGLSAVQKTLSPSFWAMLTTLLGFGSYLVVDAKPLREFGMSGGAAAFWSFISAFLLMPFFLGASTVRARHLKGKFVKKVLESILGKIIAGLLIVASLVALPWLRQLNTDPSLLSYFDSQSSIYTGLQYVDKNGGSSPLLLALKDQDTEQFDSAEVFDRSLTLHHSLEEIEQVGSIVSFPVILAEANDFTLSTLVTWEWLVDILRSTSYRKPLSGFLSKERKLALYLLRMKESSNSVTRAESLSRIRKVVRAHGFRIFRMGGIFALQKQMGELLSRSVVVSFLFSLPVFFLCGYILSRSIRVALALLLSAAVSPCILLGVNGVFGLPLDLVTVPAAILVTALGVDEMFHLIHEHRKNDYKGSRWIDDASHLSTPIVHSATILALGFSVLFFSHFPPSVRFGGFLVAGVLLSCASALLILPLMANLLSARRGR